MPTVPLMAAFATRAASSLLPAAAPSAAADAPAAAAADADAVESMGLINSHDFPTTGEAALVCCFVVLRNMV
jgi:hypothetical protein